MGHGGGVTPGFNQTGDDGNDQDRSNDPQAQAGLDFGNNRPLFVSEEQNQLDPNKYQDERQAQGEINQFVEQTFQNEIQRSKAQERKSIRRKDQERFLGYSKC